MWFIHYSLTVFTIIFSTHIDCAESSNDYYMNSISALSGPPLATIVKNKTIEKFCLNCICMNDKKCHEITNCNYDNPCGPFDIPWEYWADVGNFTIENKNNNIKKEDKKKCKNVNICIGRIIETYMNDLSEIIKVNHLNYHCDDCQKYHKKFEFTCNNLQNSKYNMIYKKCLNNIDNGDEYFKRASQKVPTIG